MINNYKELTNADIIYDFNINYDLDNKKIADNQVSISGWFVNELNPLLNYENICC